MKSSTKQVIWVTIASFCLVSLSLTQVNAASKYLEYDTASGTIYDIITTIDSTKIPDGNISFEVEIKIKNFSPDSVSIHNIQVFFRIEPYISDYGSTPDILTADGMSSTAAMMFEYNSSWGNVDLDILIKFQEEVFHDPDIITHYYETNWINVFTLKPASGASLPIISVIAAAALLGSMVNSKTKRREFRN